MAINNILKLFVNFKIFLLINMSYPESSCICSNCPNINEINQKLSPNLIQTNLITPTCTLSELFNCINVQTYLNKTEPETKIQDIPNQLTNLSIPIGSKLKGTFKKCVPELNKQPKKTNIRILNSEMGMKRATDFQTITCDNYPQAQSIEHNLNNNSTTGCSKPLYFSYDPRLKNELRPFPLLLDKPVYTGDVKLKNIYDDKLYQYGKNYNNYTDIHAGQIQYYINKELAPVLFEPNFTIKSHINGQIFVDPMGSVKFQSTRKPQLIDGSYISEYQNIRDEMEYRENLMHSQMAIPNQSNYSMATNIRENISE